MSGVVRGILRPILLVPLVLVLSPGGTARARPSIDPATCTLNGTTLTVKVPASAGANLARTSNGTILLNDQACRGATVTSVDKIKVSGGTGQQSVNIDLGQGGFKPGKTDEPGTSDEIEFQVLLGSTSNQDFLVFKADTSAVKGSNFRAGMGGFGVGQVNLNAGETNGVDADVIFTPVHTTRFVGSGLGDTLSAQGGFGTGIIYGTTIEILAGGGNDTVFGGNAFDNLQGGGAADDIHGGDGPDSIVGDAGKDSMIGNLGNDVLYANDGVSGETVNGGFDSDTCFADPGDIVSNCE